MIVIPVAVDTPLYTQRVTLDGREFILRFDWNGRENRWYFDIGTIDGAWLRRGVKVLSNWPLPRDVARGQGPAGKLFAIDLSPSDGEPPAFADFGTRVQLFYFSAAELT